MDFTLPDATSSTPVDTYARQRGLAGIGAAGQEALARLHVAVVGVGGLGCPAALYLAMAGVGRVTLIDSDRVSATNLHRQSLYTMADVGQRKVTVAERALRAHAPQLSVNALAIRLTEGNAQELLAGAHVIVDASDNFHARFAVSDAAAALGTPVVWGAVREYVGQVTVFDAAVSLRDMFPDVPSADLATCDGGAVLGTLCGTIGTAMATEVVKIATGVGVGMSGRILMHDARAGTWAEVPLRARVVKAAR